LGAAAAAGEPAPAAAELEESGPSEMQQEADRMQAELDAGALDLPDKTEKEKSQLLAAGFLDWSKADFKAFVGALERYGIDVKATEAVVAEVCEETGKQEEEVRRYYSVFHKKRHTLADSARIMDRVSKGQKKIDRLHEIADAIAMKLYRHYGKDYDRIARGPFAASVTASWAVQREEEEGLPAWSLSLGAGSTKGRHFTEDEDRFLICLLHKHGYGWAAWEAMHAEICREPAFRFDWFFISRQPSELQKRCEILLRAVERENAEHPVTMPALKVNVSLKKSAASASAAATGEESSGTGSSSSLSLKFTMKRAGGAGTPGAAVEGEEGLEAGKSKGKGRTRGVGKKRRGTGQGGGGERDSAQGGTPATKKARAAAD
jgi:SWI/SNF-related matrix-associated actin-dependent regulator of chromatin subfamily A member 5